MAKAFPIGLDIGNTVVRLLQLGGSPQDLRVLEAARFVIPPELRQDPERRRQAVIEGIRSALRERKFRRRDVVMALSERELAIRNIRMPKTPDEELATAVNWEAQNKFPFDTATAVIQHLRAGEVHQGDKVFDEVIVLAVPRAEVERRVQLATDLKLSLVSLDVEPCAVFRCSERFLQRQGDEETVSVLVDIGSRTMIVIARGRQIVFIKTIPLGGDVLNRSVAESLDLSSTEAEALRRRLARRAKPDAGEAEGPDRVRVAVADAIRPHVEDLANEIALCLRYYGVTFRGARPEAITFSGGEAHAPDLPQILGQRLGVEAKIGDPFRGVAIGHLGPVLDRRGCLGEWTTAFGLSLKGIYLAEQAEGSCAA